MPRYYCDYCDTYLTHDSASVRKQHNAGYKHKANVRAYYAQFFDQDGQRALEEKMMKMQSPGGPMMNPMGMPMRPPMGGMPPFMGDPMGFGRGMQPGPMRMPFHGFPRPGMGPGGPPRPGGPGGPPRPGGMVENQPPPQ